MAFDLPSTLSPSKVATFKDCALAFRFSAIDKIPQPPSEPAVKGTTVHRALELLFGFPPPERTKDRAEECLSQALAEMAVDEDFLALDLDASRRDQFALDATTMVERYFALEDPSDVQVIATEMMIEAELGGVVIRGIIDRLEEDHDGNLVVTDYKTGRAPGVQQERARMEGIHFYSLLCEKTLGRRPASIQLVYLGSQPQIIRTQPSEMSTRGTTRRLEAIWSAIDRACATEDFRPRQSALCNWCSYKDFCPAFGGDPELARSAVST
ncbi:MAG: PD-(D/E)XK nuclease family protein [Microthrixaceae bacterium]